MYNILTKIIYNSSAAQKDKILSDLFSYGIGQIPGLAPAFKMSGGVISFFMGRNIHDNFYNKDVFNDDEMAAGGLYKVKTFLKWEYAQTGLPFKADVYSTYKNDPIQWKIIRKTPVISRFFKRSNAGLSESLKQTAAVVGKEEAIDRIDLREEIQKSLGKINKGESNVFQEQKRIYAELGIKDYKEKRNIHKLLVGGNEKLDSAYKKAIIQAKTADQKMAIIQEMYKEVGSEEAKNIIKDLKKTGMIAKKRSYKKLPTTD
jgi:cell division protein FtsB